jgi:hypothetical protein
MLNSHRAAGGGAQVGFFLSFTNSHRSGQTPSVEVAVLSLEFASENQRRGSDCAGPVLSLQPAGGPELRLVKERTAAK